LGSLLVHAWEAMTHPISRTMPLLRYYGEQRAVLSKQNLVSPYFGRL